MCRYRQTELWAYTECTQIILFKIEVNETVPRNDVRSLMRRDEIYELTSKSWIEKTVAVFSGRESKISGQVK